uniref:Uncharacterized protein n=1 Tax=Anguilla anguilla TaxID=7936 RepID=A0A0E9T1A5_ANGAN
MILKILKIQKCAKTSNTVFYIKHSRHVHTESSCTPVTGLTAAGHRRRGLSVLKHCCPI